MALQSSLSLLIFVALISLTNALSIEEATIQDLQTSFRQNELTSRQLVEFYLKEIEKLNPVLKGVIEVNPDALILADKADRERKIKPRGSLSSLHGIPVLLKDSIGTKDKLNTSAGSFALVGSVVPRDAGVVMKLRKAGAIVLGKASMSEWATFRSFKAPNGWCARSGQGKIRQSRYNDKDNKGVPVGIVFGGLKGFEPKLIKVAYGFEQATKSRKPPTFLP